MTLAMRARPLDPERDESTLVALARHGDDEAFEQLYACYRDRIHAFILAKVRDHGRAEDLGQEVFMSALRQLRSTDKPIALKPWLYTIAKNACIDEFRRSARGREVPMEPDETLGGAGSVDPLQVTLPTPASAIESKQRLEDLRGAFGGLSENQHRLIVMREFEGLSYDEIGERLGMTRQMVESGLFRARRKLGEEYEELASGRRCEEIQSAIDAGRMVRARSLGIKERRRAARHLAHCQPCRHVAMAADVDAALLERRSLASKVAALLPLPLLRRLWAFLHGGGGAGGGGAAGGGGVAGGGAGAAGGGAGAAAGGAAAGAAGGGIGAGAAAAVAAVVLAGAGGGVALGTHGSSAAHHHAVTAAVEQVHGRPGGAATRSGARASGTHAQGSHGAAIGSRAGVVFRASGSRLDRGTSGGSGTGSGGGHGGGGHGGGGNGGSGGGGGSPHGGSSPQGGGTGPLTGTTPQKSTKTTATNGVKTTITTATNGVKTTVAGVTNGVKTTVSGVTNGVKTTVSGVTNGVNTTASGVTNGVKTTVSGVTNGVKTTVSGVATGSPSGVTNGVKTTVSGATNGVNTTVSGVTNGVKTTVSGATSGVTTTASGVTNGVKTTATGITSALGGLLGGTGGS